MIQAWHTYIEPLEDSLKSQAVKKLNQISVRTRPFVRNSFKQLDSSAEYLRSYGDLLNNAQQGAYILDQFTSTELGIIHALLNCKTKEDREAIHRKTRAELQRFRRHVIAVHEEVTAPSKKKGWFRK
jgi:hypothetical protein